MTIGQPIGKGLSRSTSRSSVEQWLDYMGNLPLCFVWNNFKLSYIYTLLKIMTI